MQLLLPLAMAVFLAFSTSVLKTPLVGVSIESADNVLKSQVEESFLIEEAEDYELTIAAVEKVAPSESRVALGDYFTVDKHGVSEDLLNQRIKEVLLYINSLPHQATVAKMGVTEVARVNTSEYATVEYVLKSFDKHNDSRRSNTQTSFDNLTITDSTLAGVTYVSGFMGLGTTSPAEILSVAGAVYLDEYLPSNAVNRLYNVGGNLYWNGTVLSSSSSWSGSGGNVYRLANNVGIGTSTPGDTLTVDGTLSAGTTTTRIFDTGGQVCNVKAYGAVGDNSTDNYAAIVSTIAACPEGGVVYFPMGEYRISQTIVLDKPITLRGSYSPRWSYSSTPRSSIRADFGGFTGNAIIHVRDRTISGQAQDNNGGRLENISLDGGSTGANVHGVHFEGLVRDWKLTDVDISQTTGNGFVAEVGAGSGNPRGFTIRGLSIYSADGHGFRATALNDSYLEDVLTVGNALRGFYLSSMGETKVNNSRAVFNALEGLYIDGSSNNGGMMFTDFSTDRNDRHGVRISLTGTTSVTFNGLLTRRDGANVGGGTETPYAGVAVIGTTTQSVAPVFINGLSQIVGVDDSGNPPVAPLVGVRVVNALYVKVEGQLWGLNEAYRDEGGNQLFAIEDNSIIKTGTGWAEASPTVFNNKWIATSSGLYYDGGISIGSTTGSRLLTITAPAQAGARFQDTTNNVIFDMRAEDYQGFFGTFSNHQLRFQTNNLSRLTIDTSGRVGIGTTSPDQVLDVIGTIQSSDLLGGSISLSTDVNGNIIRNPSDLRLKNNILPLTDSLEKVLELRGVTYKWKDTDRFGSETEIGFIAQEVDIVVPEVVRKGGEYWSLNTANLLAVVVEAIKEIWETVTGNSRKINQLEDRVVNLERMLDVASESADESNVESNNDNIAVDESVAEEESSEVVITIVSTSTVISEKSNDDGEIASPTAVVVENVEDSETDDDGDVDESDSQNGEASDSENVENDGAHIPPEEMITEENDDLPEILPSETEVEYPTVPSE